jgi:hypothetical protein
MSDDILVEVMWDTSSKVIAKLRVDPSATLRDMHSALVGARPVLENKEFMYLYHGKPVFREFWNVFEAQDFAPTLIMRAGSVGILVKRDVDENVIRVSSPNSSAPLLNKQLPSQQAALSQAASPRNANSSVVSTKVPKKVDRAPEKPSVGMKSAKLYGDHTDNESDEAPPLVPDESDHYPSMSEDDTPQVKPQSNRKPMINSGVKPVYAPASKPAVPSTPKSAPPQLADDGKMDLDEEAAGQASDMKSASGSSGGSKAVRKVEALYAYTARSVDQLSFRKGDTLEILIYRPKGKWWFARLGENKGWIPHNFVKVVEEGPMQAEKSVDKSKRPLPGIKS